jgi:hypothetical protein
MLKALELQKTAQVMETKQKQDIRKV